MYFRQKLAFLDTLLTATIDGRPLTNQEIYEEVSTFIFEGHDTTSSAISFMVYILSLYPEIQKKLYDEQVNLFGNNMNRDPTYQEISEMNYLDLTLKETLRMFPSVPIIGRHCEHDIHLSK